MCGIRTPDTGFSNICICVSSVIINTAFVGFVWTTWKVRGWLSTYICIISPSTTTYSLSLCLMYWRKLASTAIVIDTGASFMKAAGLGSTFLTFTVSLSETSAFFRRMLFILITPLPLSSGNPFHTLAAVFLLPTISTTSPTTMPPLSIASGSILTTGRLASRALLSRTLSSTHSDTA